MRVSTAHPLDRRFPDGRDEPSPSPYDRGHDRPQSLAGDTAILYERLGLEDVRAFQVHCSPWRPTTVSADLVRSWACPQGRVRTLFGPLCLQGVADPARGGPSQQRSHRLHGPVRGRCRAGPREGVASLVIGLILALTAGFLAYE